MSQLTYDEVINLVKTNNLSYYNFYNTDIPTSTLYTSEYYKNYTHDTIDVDQKVNTFFLDIEVFTSNEGISDNSYIHPIHMITGHCTEDNILWVYVLFLHDTMSKFGISTDSNFDYNTFIVERQDFFLSELRKGGYLGHKFIPDQYEIRLQCYVDEKQLLLDFWDKLHEYDPDVISGWNSDLFDLPYIYGRLTTLFGKENADMIISKFGVVENRYGVLQIFEYTIADLLYIYRPRDEGGFYGSH